eukprot:11510408-Karenia_brevis.AAC.1
MGDRAAQPSRDSTTQHRYALTHTADNVSPREAVGGIGAIKSDHHPSRVRIRQGHNALVHQFTPRAPANSVLVLTNRAPQLLTKDNTSRPSR